MHKIIFLFASIATAQQTVSYRLSFPNAAHHEAEISVTFSGISQPILEVEMSRSSPGRYALHEFVKNVYAVRATGASAEPLSITRSDPYSWKIAGHHGTVVVSYTLFGDHADGTYAGIDATHAHLNMPATLLWARGFENASVTLAFEPPAGSGWRAATQLVPLPDGRWSAPNFAYLMDSPVELSAHRLAEWRTENLTFRLAIHQQAPSEAAKAYAQMCQAVVLEEEGVFGSFPKFDNGAYTFLADFLPYIFGDGMEHRNSTSMTSTGELKATGRGVGTAAHEFFHAWNVKRIRPASLEPFDFERADMSGELWFAEGFTSYYGPLAVRRAGLSTTEEFVENLSRAVDAVLTHPGRDVFSVVEMSQRAPFVDAASSIDATNISNTFISYYTYGAALGMGLDLAIRARFPGKSLDSWMQTMWRLHPDANLPYTLEDLETALAETTGDAAFANQIFNHHIKGKEPLDYQALLAPAGLQLRKRHAGKAWLGTDQLQTSAGGVTIGRATLKDSPIYGAGLDKGDEISSCDEKAVKKAEDLTSCLAKHNPGDKLAMEATTRAGFKKIFVQLVEDPSLEIVTYEQAGLKLTDPMRLFRDSWLSSKALHRANPESITFR